MPVLREGVEKMYSKVARFFKEAESWGTRVFSLALLVIIFFIFWKIYLYCNARIAMIDVLSSLLSVDKISDNEVKIKAFFVQNDLKTQDFITVVTGLLALIIASVGIGSYISFKKLKEEEVRFRCLGNKFEALLKIAVSAMIDPLNATGDDYKIRLYNEIEKKINDYDLLFVLRGEEYYYKKMYIDAIDNFIRAIEIDSTLARAWFGWGQALFRVSSTEEVISKQQVIWDFDTFYKNSHWLKMHNSNLKITKSKAKEVITKIEKAQICGYEESRVNFELGRIHEAMINGDGSEDLLDIAIDKYRTAYYSNNIDAGLYYCVAWIRKYRYEIISKRINKDASGIVEVLKIISNSLHKSLACALLCYLYCIAQREAEAKRIFQETNDMAINELFFLKAEDSEGAPCSSSPA